MEFSVRRVREGDAEAIVEFLNPIIRRGVYTVMDEPLTVDDQRDFIREFPRRGVFHVAVCKDRRKIVGIQDVRPLSRGEDAFDHVGVMSTFVSLAALRKGIGRGLCNATVPVAREQGFLKLMVTIRADNPRAVSFYQDQAFQVIGTARKHALVGGRYIDEILAERFIG